MAPARRRAGAIEIVALKCISVVNRLPQALGKLGLGDGGDKDGGDSVGSSEGPVAAPVPARRVRGVRTMASAASAESPKVATKGDLVKGAPIIDVRDRSRASSEKAAAHTPCHGWHAALAYDFLGYFP
jgi:hypothetical protein